VSSGRRPETAEATTRQVGGAVGRGRERCSARSWRKASARGVRRNG